MQGEGWNKLSVIEHSNLYHEFSFMNTKKQKNTFLNKLKLDQLHSYYAACLLCQVWSQWPSMIKNLVKWVNQLWELTFEFLNLSISVKRSWPCFENGSCKRKWQLFWFKVNDYLAKYFKGKCLLVNVLWMYFNFFLPGGFFLSQFLGQWNFHM